MLGGFWGVEGGRGRAREQGCLGKNKIGKGTPLAPFFPCPVSAVPTGVPEMWERGGNGGELIVRTYLPRYIGR